MQQAVHHATLYYGADAVHTARVQAEALLGATSIGNPDLTEIDLISFGIDESRSLKERAAQRPVTGEAQVFLVVTRTITVPAQNALLKLLEEPQQGTYFFFVMPGPERLLPTVLSRMRTFYVSGEIASDNDEEALRFLAATPFARIKQVEGFYSKPEKDRVGTEQFVDRLERTLYRKLHTENGVDRAIGEKLKQVLAVRGYLPLPSSSPKLILEHLALVL